MRYKPAESGFETAVRAVIFALVVYGGAQLFENQGPFAFVLTALFVGVVWVVCEIHENARLDAKH